jgi:hypothetical protein
MKRRKFIQTLAVTPAAALPVVSESQAQTPAQRPQGEAPKSLNLEASSLDVGGETTPRFFSAQQLAALRKLCNLILPPINGMPGALETGAPEFLDFHVSKSGAERQQLYKGGLDSLNAQATKRFGKAFAEVTETQASELLAPLRQAWTYVPPTDPFARFLREAKQDIRNATINSREYTMAASSGGRRGGGLGQYWYPID